MKNFPIYRNSILFCVILILLGCNYEKENFSNWFTSNYYYPTKITPETKSKHYFTFNSNSLKIDSIYRSMQGPYNIATTNIENDPNELIWITGYSCILTNNKMDSLLPYDFMCHNNLNILNKTEIPWSVKTKGTDIRLFTLSQGQTKIKLPNGFGIPMPANHPIQIMSQVLNHNILNPDYSIKHKVKLEYVKQSEIKNPLKPLYTQTLFITKQTSGPAGEYGLPLSCIEHNKIDSNNSSYKYAHNCEINYEGENYNPYKDEYGRVFTGHWNIDHKIEEVSTNVTQMLNLTSDSKIHFISVHLHPFATSLVLRDITLDSTLFKAKAYNYQNKIGLKSIDYYSSKEGINLYSNHQYHLISSYNCLDTNNIHTAMATMVLYLSDY